MAAEVAALHVVLLANWRAHPSQPSHGDKERKPTGPPDAGRARAGPEHGVFRPLVILMSRWLAPVSGANIFKIMFHRRDEGGRSTVTPPTRLGLCDCARPPPPLHKGRPTRSSAECGVGGIFLNLKTGNPWELLPPPLPPPRAAPGAPHHCVSRPPFLGMPLPARPSLGHSPPWAHPALAAALAT